MKPLEQQIAHLPNRPGVYLFKDKKGNVLYIGKAGDIQRRVQSYFQRTGGKDVKTLAMLEKVAKIDTIVTDTEKEAFILENNLIKANRPRYNVKLRDDKNYPCLRLNLGEEYPTLQIVRKIKKDPSLYFGPYPSATSLRETLKLIRRLFPIRTCVNTKFRGRLRPCINYEMNRCLGPCCGKTDPKAYQEVVNQVRMFLEGKNRDLIESLKRQMEKESEQLHFEKAAKIRDQIESIEHVVERQKMVSSDFIDQDVIGFYRQDHGVVVHPLFVRGGKLLGGQGFSFASVRLPDEEVLSTFLHQYYQKGRLIPEQILVPLPIPDQISIEEWLSDLRGKKVRITVPLKGEKRHLLKMAEENAKKFLLSGIALERDERILLQTLKEKLYLRKIPHRIEAFDISNLQGRNAVGSMVSFENGKPSKGRYRHFKIKTIEGADDYGMMYEVLLRRYQKALEEGDLPDLVLLDGGRGHLNVAQEVFKELGITEVDLISLAKERVVEGPRVSRLKKTEEKIFHPQYKEPFILGRYFPVLHFLDRIRDEAHRFALRYHQKVRGRELILSELDGIPEIGKIRQKALLRFFGSLERIKAATEEELAKAPKMNRTAAQIVYQFFKRGEK